MCKQEQNDTVCGCDGNTYANWCWASFEGLNVAHEGECVDGELCTDNADCPSGSYCKKDMGDCEGEGICAEMSENCIEIYAPVCGCDKNTYANSCFAASDGENVLHEGECS
jgi:hypothetical protein